MANYTTLIKTIDDNIKANGNQEITGPVLNAVLQAIVSGLSEGALFAGIATPATNPPAYDGNVFYIATEPGTYSNFGVIVPNGSIGIIYNTSSDWAVRLINTYYEIDVETLMQDSPSSEDINEAIGSFTYLKRAITVGVPFFGKGASGGNSTVAIAQVKQLSDIEVRVVMLNTGTVDGSNELVPIIKKITNSAGQLSLSTEAPTSFIGPLSSLNTNKKGSVVEAINEVNTGLKSAVKPYVVDLTSLLAAQDSQSISTAIGGIDSLNGTVQKNQVIFGTLANGTVAVGIRVLGNQTTLTYFVDSVVGLTVNEVIITNTDGTLSKTVNTHAVLTENMVIDSLESDETTLPLSAAQGKVLNEKIQSSALGVYYTNMLLAIDFTSSNLTDDDINQYIGSWDGLVNAIQSNTPIFDKVKLEGHSGSQYTIIPVVAGMSTEDTVDMAMFAGVDESYRQIKIVKVADNNYTLISAKKVILDNDNNADLLTDNKTITGAINENFNSIKTTNKSIGQPTIEEIELTTPDETGYVWLTNHTKTTSAGYSIKHFQLNKGDLLLVNAFGSTSVNIIQLTDNTYSKSANEDLYAGIDSLKTYSYLAIEDCFVAVSYAISAPGSYIHLVKSSQNIAIADAASSTAALHKVYESYGAVYNKESGYWELNGLTDLTEEEMYDIYLWTHNIINQPDLTVAFAQAPIRTTFAYSFKKIYRNTIGVSLDQAFLTCNQLEVICLNPISDSQIQISYTLSTACHNAFNGCSKLREISNVLYISRNSQNIFVDAFVKCSQLSKVRIRGLRQDVSFADSPLISYESLNYIVTNAANTSAITVTVHPTTYSYLTGTAQPTAEVGGTTEEWQALVTSAQAKQISFAVPEETQSEVTE